jgi:inhibitor of KinA sporulation pathway (predicted exonuclease)
MKARELKKLNKEFKEFIDERTFVNLRTAIAEFWFAKFGCNNQKREDELYIYFLFRKVCHIP